MLRELVVNTALSIVCFIAVVVYSITSLYTTMEEADRIWRENVR